MEEVADHGLGARPRARHSEALLDRERIARGIVQRMEAADAKAKAADGGLERCGWNG